MNLEISCNTLKDLFEETVEKHSSRPCPAFAGHEAWTYAETAERVRSFQEILRTLGVKQGNPVIILGPSSPNWAVAYLAVTTMGAVAVPVLDEFPETDIDHIIHHSEARVFCVARSLFQGLCLPSIRKDQPVVILDDLSVQGGDKPEGFWKRVQSAFKGKPHKNIGEPVKIHEKDLAEILYTSGTTGHSKGVMLTHGNLVTNALAAPAIIPEANENAVVLNVLPLAHAFGCTSGFLSILACGASLFFMEKKPSPKLLLAAMQQVRPTILPSVPLIYEKIYHKQVLPQIQSRTFLRLMSSFGWSRKIVHKMVGKKVMKLFGGRLEVAVVGGASLSHEVEVFLREAGIPYVLGYGLSECAPLVTACAPSDTRMGAVGFPIPGVTVKIENPNPKSGVGEIYVKGPNVMKGYFKSPEDTNMVLTGDGWLRTGDRGYRDEDGYLFIKGRSKNVIVGPSGENIYPEIIEDLCKNSPFVEEVLVYSDNNQIVARIYPDYAYFENLLRGKGESALAKEITESLERHRRDVNHKLPAFSKIKRVIEQTEPFAVTPTKKIKRGLYVPDYGSQTANPEGDDL